MGLDMMIRDTEGNDVAYWRKVPSVHEWFRQLGIKKGIDKCEDPEHFNGIEVPIVKEDISDLINDLCAKNMDYEVKGFFFGSDKEMDDLHFAYYMRDNFDQIENMLIALKKGKDLYYTSWW